MKRRNLWIGVLFVVVLMPSVLWAGGRMHGKWWHDKSMVQELNLTDSEREKLDDKYIASRRSMIDLKSEVEKQRFELNLLLTSPQADRQRIMELYGSLQQAKTRLSQVRFEMFLDVREIIGVERFQELKTMYRRGRDKKHRERSWEDGSSRRDRYGDRD